ncbi:MAG: hypothetical protein K2Y01_10955 [Rhabdochlamydiaceae bacterium]|nr:hypothetical protein [Rhabdochlamydiaceae bacterium]
MSTIEKKLHNVQWSTQNQPPLEEKKPFWTPSKIALAALGTVVIVFIAYQASSRNLFSNTNTSKVCSLESSPFEEQIKTVANKLKIAYQRRCSSSDSSFLERIDKLTGQIYTAGLSGPFFPDKRYHNSLEAQSTLHIMAKTMIPRTNCDGIHPTLKEMASTCTTDEGLLTEERYGEIKLASSRTPWPDEELKNAYQNYLSEFSDFCTKASEWGNS